MKIDFRYLYLCIFYLWNYYFQTSLLCCRSSDLMLMDTSNKVVEILNLKIYLHFKLTSFKCCFQNCQNNQQKTLPFKLLLKSAVECCQNLSLENLKLSIKSVNPVINMFKNSRFVANILNPSSKCTKWIWNASR